MSADLKLYRALTDCETTMHEIPGVDVAWALDQACADHLVDRGEVAVLWLRRLFAAQRARAELASMVKADAQIDAGTSAAAAPHAHRVTRRRRAAA